MTTRERLLAAVRCQDVDYVPMVIGFGGSSRHRNVTYRNERERLAFFRERGWDTFVPLSTRVSPMSQVQVATTYPAADGAPTVQQLWHTPVATLTERLRATDDWEAARARTVRIPLEDDFRPSRYLEVPFKSEQDLAALPYIFPLDNPLDTQRIIQEHAAARALANEFDVPLVANHSAGMDWLLWLYPAQEAVIRLVEAQGMIRRLLGQINAAFGRRLELALELGVNAVIRRGWYESTDFWSPGIFKHFAYPALEKEMALCRQAGVAHIYQMCTGVLPLLPMLAELPFDCLIGYEPVYGGQLGTLKRVRSELPGKSLWGGISGPEHLGRGTAEEVEQAVEKAFADCGKRGFILGPGVVFRNYWPWENLEAMERTWRRLR
jgi:uroporphyrinogen-III decarboxylase